MSEALQTTGNQYLDLIRQVVTNPEVPVEKIKALMDMQLLLEDREAEKGFDAALIRAQKEIEALKWDKLNLTNKSRHVSYPKIEKMLRPVREKHGFVQSYDTEISDAPNTMIFCCNLSHSGGHTRRYRLPMPIDGQGPKGGGVMTGPQAVGNGTSYAMRYLDKMIWNIPMLVDQDDNDGNVDAPLITKSQAADLRALAEEVLGAARLEAGLATFCKYFKIEKPEDLLASHYERAVKAFEKKRSKA